MLEKLFLRFNNKYIPDKIKFKLTNKQEIAILYLMLF